MDKKKLIKPKTTRKKRENKGKKEEKGKIKIILREDVPLEEKVEIRENEGREEDMEEFGSFLMQPEISKVSPSLRRINAPPRIPFRLEENLAQSTSSPSFNEEEEDSVKYNLMESGKKKEIAYNVVSQEYLTLQKESIKNNPQLLIKEQSFINLDQKNIVDDFSKKRFNPFAEEEMRSSGKKDDNYVIKPSFIERERKPHNPFEKKEKPYEHFEQ